MNDMVMFQGVVEDRNDPLKLARVKVRCFGFHTSDKNSLPTADLPWAHPINPITSASQSGVGDSPVGPVEGTWVIGFFRDGEEAQFPIFFGTIPGIESQEAKTGEGFYDPTGNYPREPGKNGVDRLTRNEEIDQTIVQEKRDNLDTTTSPVGLGSTTTTTEPETPYNAQYPFNHVKTSESGHIQEFDDTEGSERIHTYHRSGTFEEIHPDGTTVTKVVKDNYVAILGDDTLHVKGTVNVQVEGDANIGINGNTNFDFGGNLNVKIGGMFTMQGGGAMSMSSDSSIEQKAPRIDLN